jgi:hypothetical protein
MGKQGWRSRIAAVIGGAVILLIAVGCGTIWYRAALPSAYTHLLRFAALPSTQPYDLAVVRTTLLRHLPPGTARPQVVQWIQSRGATYDDHWQRTYRTLIGCFPSELHLGITCNVREDQERLAFPCREGYRIEFHLTRDSTLRDVQVESTSVCL